MSVFVPRSLIPPAHAPGEAIFAHRAMQRPIAEAEQLAGPLQELRTLSVSRRDPGLARRSAGRLGFH